MKEKANSMRYDYMKDIMHLKESIFRGKNLNKMEFIDVRYFEGTKDLDHKT